jgi:hypothetical protein
MFDTEQANCLGVDPELFFPNGAINPQTEKTLRRICVNCSVWRECYDYAMAYRVDGFWAGTTYQNREALRKELGITAKRIDEQYEKEIKTNRATQRMREAG